MGSAMDRARELRQQVERLGNRHQEEIQAEHLEKRRKEVAELRAALADAAVPAGLLAQRGYLAGPPLPQTDTLEETLAALLKRAKDEPPESFGKGAEYKRFQAQLKKLTEALGSQVSSSWEGFKAALPQLSEELLRDIELVPGQAPVVAQVRDLGEQLRQRVRQLPRTAAELDAIVQLGERLRDKMAGLDNANYPEDVRRFLREAQALGAPLALFTDNVRRWLEAKGLLNGIRVRWSSPVGPRKP